MSKLVKIISKTGKCLCKGCILFERLTPSCCPIAYSEENIKFVGELLPEWPGKNNYNDKTAWCKFKHCGTEVGEQREIWNNPGYKVEGRDGQFMWIPESIVILEPKEKKGRAIKNRSRLAWIATK